MNESYDNAANEAGVAFATLLFRLLRSAQMHEVKSLLSQGTLATSVATIKEVAGNAGGFMVAMFAGETVFVNGQPVRTQRAVYENILAVGEMLAKYSLNEITIRSSVTAEDLAALLELLVHGKREYALPNSVTLQYVDPASILGGAEGQQTMVEKVAAVYGAATVLVRRCNDHIVEDDPRLMRHVKRVSQRLVTLTRTGFAELLTLARRPAAPSDHAAIAVNAAVIGALAGRALTADVHTLLRITMAALQAEIGKPRVAGMYRSDGFQTAFVPQLNQQQRQRLPASTAVMLLQAGRAAEQPLMRAVVAYETAFLSDGKLLGWPYEGQIPPTVEAVISSLATRVSFAMATAGGPDDLVRMLNEAEIGKVERAGLDLIYSILGLIAVGTPVEMANGWRAVVVSAGDNFAQLERTHVVVLLDQHRRELDPRVVRAGGEAGWIKTVVTLDDPALSRAYEAYVARAGDAYDLPSTTGVLQPDVADHIRDRATLDFDADEATNVVDANVARFLPPAPSPSPSPPPVEQAPDTFRARIDSGVGLPKQFQTPPTSGPAAAIPKQFQSGPPKPNERAPGAWSPAKPDPAPEAKNPAETEPKKGDDSSEDDDFDALANIVLFD